MSFAGNYNSYFVAASVFVLLRLLQPIYHGSHPQPDPSLIPCCTGSYQDTTTDFTTLHVSDWGSQPDCKFLKGKDYAIYLFILQRFVAMDKWKKRCWWTLPSIIISDMWKKNTFRFFQIQFRCTAWKHLIFYQRILSCSR